MDSILTSIKKLLGIDESYTHFDADIILHINSVFSILTQLGVGPKEGFFIEDDSTEWTEFLPDSPKLNFVKSYVQLKVRLLFDPPDKGSLMDALTRTISELEWRIQVAADPVKTNGEEENQNVGV